MPLPPAGAVPERPPRSQDLRPLDDVDRAILTALRHDARVSNTVLAGLVGVAQSTCLARVRALRDRGVIRGYHADVDPRAVGLGVQAMIAIRLQPHARGKMAPFTAVLSCRPEVLEVYFVAGANDFLVHVACADTDALRDFVADHLNRDAAIAGTETNLIFEHTRATGLGGPPDRATGEEASTLARWTRGYPSRPDPAPATPLAGREGPA